MSFMNIFFESKASAIKYWEDQPTDQPWLLNGFKGTWAFSDHSTIPDTINEFLLEHYRDRLGEIRKGHVKVIPLNEINDLLNQIWEGPGSMVKLVNLTYDIRQERYETNPINNKDPLKGYIIPTIESDLEETEVDEPKE